MDKRPCSICKRWFYPDPRVGARQQACSDPACQVARRKKTQAKWRATNPDYAIGRRLTVRHAKHAATSQQKPPAQEAPAQQKPPTPRLPAPLDQLPWDVAQDQFGAQGADFMKEFGRLLVRSGQDRKDQMRAQVLDSS